VNPFEQGVYQVPSQWIHLETRGTLGQLGEHACCNSSNPARFLWSRGPPARSPASTASALGHSDP